MEVEFLMRYYVSINGNAFDIDGEVETATATPVSPRCNTAQHCFLLCRPSTQLRCILLLLRLVLYLFPLLIVLHSNYQPSAIDPVDFAASANPLLWSPASTELLHDYDYDYDHDSSPLRGCSSFPPNLPSSTTS
ncbi:hypothetical protein NA56DRAFT_707195 [Hyaloscypha hepaticicola]|uniref:Uncharacterized protein n=1 Tax=Hyaloscypha hepaticicola TaxID=2082293 RepID=A0A2J6PUY1_9HELO|nr:hypothetical protein NA56DRAFT_707195 [Hyaloscypha hepaticicola]